MRKSIKFASMFVAAASLAFAGFSISNDQSTTNLVNQKVEASATTYIKMPKGYTRARVIKANNGNLSSADHKALVKASMAGMKDNQFSDDDTSDNNKIVTVTDLSKDEQVELSHYAMDLINSARSQMGKRNWTYRAGALHFANKVAVNYDKDGASCWDADHDVHGIERAAKTCGLNSTVGQVYEDEAGLPISSEWNGNKRSMRALKQQVYFNVKQMLFGGYAGNDMNNASAYTEWEHAGDLLGLRSAHNYDAKTKYFGMSFSSLDGKHISVHMMGVAKRYIENYKKFNK